MGCMCLSPASSSCSGNFKGPSRASTTDSFHFDPSDEKKVTIVQAARATSATPGFFPALELRGGTFVDCGIGANNPTQKMIKEVRFFTGKRKAALNQVFGAIVNIGSAIGNVEYALIPWSSAQSIGSTSSRMFNMDLEAMSSSKARVISRSVKEMDESGIRALRQLFGAGELPYIRYDGGDLQEKLSIHGWKPFCKANLETIQRWTEEYLHQPDVADSLTKTARLLVQYRALRAQNSEKWDTFHDASHLDESMLPSARPDNVDNVSDQRMPIQLSSLTADPSDRDASTRAVIDNSTYQLPERLDIQREVSALFKPCDTLGLLHAIISEHKNPLKRFAIAPVPVDRGHIIVMAATITSDTSNTNKASRVATVSADQTTHANGTYPKSILRNISDRERKPTQSRTARFNHNATENCPTRENNTATDPTPTTVPTVTRNEAIVTISQTLNDANYNKDKCSWALQWYIGDKRGAFPAYRLKDWTTPHDWVAILPVPYLRRKMRIYEVRRTGGDWVAFLNMNKFPWVVRWRRWIRPGLFLYMRYESQIGSLDDSDSEPILYYISQ
ncbi:hypothetical protein K432DRAFT_445641 [Lepidopterella palustris CBS 459.81]|uniref:PNPLA domain-containing protein n=1 Tax=Lepidopterella palustris CBS 459.81 TaxID=1314670 RepID=A0A8E2E4I8_9PEZI|nr:hypothetical protein K432DRAFT_445641 [Lepidopterella palustris CBS 459.81]